MCDAMKPIEILQKRIEAKLKELNVSARKVSLAATGQPAAIRNILGKNAMPRIDRLDAIAVELETTSDWLLGREMEECTPSDHGREIGHTDQEVDPAIRVHLGHRLKLCLDNAGISQATLARDVGISQPSVHYLINSPIGARGSKHLRSIARRLRVADEYLEGLTDDRAIGHGDQSPAVHVTMQVAMPSTNALAAMFRGLLRHIDLTQSRADIARQLAETLPIGLAQLSDLAPDPVEVRHHDAASPASSPAMHHPEPQS